MRTIATEAKTSLSKNNFSVYTVQCEIAFSNKVLHRTIITRTKKAARQLSWTLVQRSLYFKLWNADQVSILGIMLKDSLCQKITQKLHRFQANIWQPSLWFILKCYSRQTNIVNTSRAIKENLPSWNKWD